MKLSEYIINMDVLFRLARPAVMCLVADAKATGDTGKSGVIHYALETQWLNDG